MATALIHFDPKQKARLARRAKRRGRSFSQEVRNAVDLYLDVPVESEEELKVLARQAKEVRRSQHQETGRNDRLLDRILKEMRKPK